MSGVGFAIDRGGTFTDVYCRRADGSSRVYKLLSDDPANYDDAPTEAIRRILNDEFHTDVKRGEPVPTQNIAWIRMGTTVATNALLERDGEPCALVVTKGFKDLLYIGNQTRPSIFDLNIQIPSVLYTDVVEVDERVILHSDRCEMVFDADVRRVTASTGDRLIVLKEVDEEEVHTQLLTVFQKGIRSLAVILMHSYMYAAHEEHIGRIALRIGFTNVSLSSTIMPMMKAVPRGFTACADAYLTPKIKTYLDGFRRGFVNRLEGVVVHFMQSDGGLCPFESFFGSRAILSGPAAGVVGVALTAYDKTTPVIGFDMGGTSTDVSRYDGHFDHVFETTTAGVTIQAPQLDISTVAAGGGSRLFFYNGLFVVGPESARAHPGPVCYRKGGHLAITDANIILGRIIPEYFPHIFGEGEDEPLDRDASIKAMQCLYDTVMRRSLAADMSMDEVAMGYIDVANEAMCRPIRSLTQAKGFDTSAHILASFGGAGGQHACAIAQSLGMKTVYIHRYAPVLSAYGLALADVVHELQTPMHTTLEEENFGRIDDQLDRLAAQGVEILRKQGFTTEQIIFEPYLHMRYDRTDCALMTSPKESSSSSTTRHGDFALAFRENYKREFGFDIADRRICVDDVRVRCIGRNSVREDRRIGVAVDPSSPPLLCHSSTYFVGVGRIEAPVYQLEALLCGHRVDGPALIIDDNSTIVIEPDCHADITEDGSVRVTIGDGRRAKIGTAVDAIQLSIFSHRFMSIAEQMGRILQRTSISTNIKERLDFSCALFGPDGGLIANAPHIPVHLGAMQETVKYQLRTLGSEGMHEGDVILCNHPQAGGSHLPDLTVITPVYDVSSSNRNPVFFVANRGHHAEIGGIVPGSMPPHSTSLDEEGARFVSFKLVENGVFREKEVVAEFASPSQFEGCSGSRNVDDNLSDLRAQVAANNKGIALVHQLIAAYGLDVVQAYMAHIQHNAEMAVRALLVGVGEGVGREGENSVVLHAEDSMDDGTCIKLNITIDRKSGDAHFDFGGTGIEVYSSTNAPPAVTLAAVIYSLRCLVGREIPLNQGCLAPITIALPPGSILNAHPNAAVVGGNVLTSQRIVDVVLQAFKKCGDSQGCMNNITFGDDSFGYYETVGGGAGGGDNYEGRSGVHSHMTNTRITDVEVIERRYPIIIGLFALRPDSGGGGARRGGDGIVRHYVFRKCLTLSILTERRVFAPHGMAGGEEGARGTNVIYKSYTHAANLRPDPDIGRSAMLPSKSSITVNAGDIFLLETPGGGGFGAVAKP